MPPAVPTVSRRSVLVGTAALAILGVTAACGSTPPAQDVDALVDVLERARADSAAAGRSAAAARPPLAAALKAVAAERAAHAGALTDEIIRISGEAPTATPTSSAPTSGTSAPSGTSTPPPPPPPPPPTASEVLAALKQSADGAALLAANQSGYRAGLLGSIAACCTALATVTLADVRTSS